ncbi:hypothetical protein BU17DRAFT_95681 [Hysterangium stoloniferum]|nr:hypothetical protein BU17DRAFT_95681 [Hysterangium stoloniferum]
MAAPPLKLLIPERHNGRWRSQAHHAHHAHPMHNSDAHICKEFTINNLSLEMVKRIWSTYPTLNIQKKNWESRCENSSSNTLGLDLGIHVPSYNHNAINMIASEPPAMGGDSNASSALDAIDADTNTNTSSTLLAPEPMSNMDSEREPGEVWEETSSPGLRPPSLVKMSVADQPMLDEARAALVDSFIRNARMHDRDHRMSDHDLRVKYVERMTDEEVRHFMALGKNVMDDLRRTGKLEDVKRKYGHLQDTIDEATRNTKRKLEKHLEDEASGSVQSSSGPPTAPRAMRSSPRPSQPQRLYKRDSTPLRNSGRIAMSISPPPTTRRPEVASSRHSSEHPRLVPPGLPPTEPVVAVSTPVTSRTSLPLLPFDVMQPRIVLAKQSGEFAGTIQTTFDVDERLLAAAQRWTDRSQRFDVAGQHMRLYLTSVLAREAEVVYKALPPDPPPSLLPEMLSKMDIVWPPDGSFFVLINENRPEEGKTPGSPPLNISHALVPGENTIKLVQLHDHADVLFLVIAIPPSDDEIQEELLWHKYFGDDPKPGEVIKVQFRI